MGARSRELLLLLAVCAFALSEPVNRTAKKIAKPGDNILYQYDDYDAADDQEVLFNEDRPCPRDCICTVSQGYRIAKCNRLELETQKFGDDITDLVIENADPDYPIELSDLIFKKLGLHLVATVKIVNSTIGSISHSAFHGLHELYAVNLSNNKLKTIHPETFANNKKLLLLTLSHNSLEFDSEKYFLNASSVQELDVSYCNIQNITASTFRHMPGLMYLNIAGNKLTSVDRDAFKKLLDLEELDMSDNSISLLSNDIFSENTELATLHIQRNPIDTVYGVQINDLLTLNAGQTNITFIGPSMFNGMTYIANLNLSGNSIRKIHNQAFHKLVELNYLDLSYNDLDLISSILIKENIELDILKISNNPRLKHLPAEGFSCSADQFNIYLFDASNCGLEEIFDDSLKTFTALSQLNLSGNNIKSISNQVFSRCTKLVDVNLAYNLLPTLDPKVFEQNKELAKLNLQGNPLKVLSAEVFIHTPLLTRLDMSHAELTSLWKVDKNHPATLLNNLNFLNVSHNRITEIKQNELETLNKLRTFDIGYNALACNRDFENLMSWLTKRKVSPNAISESISNLAKNAKEEEEEYSWEALTSKTCGSALPHPVEPLPPVSDEEIWERIDKDSEGNFDLKNTLEDNRVSDPVLKTPTQDPKINDSDYDEDLPEDDEEEEDEEGEDDDDSGEEYDEDNDVDLKVKLVDKPTKTKPTASSTTAALSTTGAPTPVEADKDDKMKLDIKLLDNDNLYDELEPDVYVKASIEDIDHGHYDYLWPIVIAILGAVLLLLVIGKIVMLACARRNRQIRYNSAIIAAMNNQGRTKKDCGLVYQQLSEDLTGPKTPKLSRYAPLPSVTINASNMYESSPFHHNNIVPEAV